jgi:hypothetical protein
MRQVRARNERIQQVDLAGAVGDARALADAVEAAGGRVDRARAALAAATARRAAALATGASSAALAREDRYLRRLRHELEAVQGERARAEAGLRGQQGAVELARGRLAHARTERELIERHFAAWRAERAKLAERRED